MFYLCVTESLVDVHADNDAFENGREVCHENANLVSGRFFLAGGYSARVVAHWFSNLKTYRAV